MGLDVGQDGVDTGLLGGIDLVDHDDVGKVQVDFARVVTDFVTRAVRIGDGAIIGDGDFRVPAIVFYEGVAGARPSGRWLAEEDALTTGLNLLSKRQKPS